MQAQKCRVARLACRGSLEPSRHWTDLIVVLLQLLLMKTFINHAVVQGTKKTVFLKKKGILSTIQSQTTVAKTQYLNIVVAGPQFFGEQRSYGGINGTRGCVPGEVYGTPTQSTTEIEFRSTRVPGTRVPGVDSTRAPGDPVPGYADPHEPGEPGTPGNSYCSCATRVGEPQKPGQELGCLTRVPTSIDPT
eukprot:3051918-Rhodomonas_salina.2